MKSNTNKDDYLKYWRVVRHFIKVKYGLQQSDLEMILFLYSERYFDRDKFRQFDSLLSWNKTRFERLRKEGWIQMFRNRVGARKALYQLSDHAINVVRLVYRKLNGEEIPTSAERNPMFKRKVSYSDKVYRNMIIEMNSFIQQQRHQTRVSQSNDPHL